MVHVSLYSRAAYLCTLQCDCTFTFLQVWECWGYSLVIFMWDNINASVRHIQEHVGTITLGLHAWMCGLDITQVCMHARVGVIALRCTCIHACGYLRSLTITTTTSVLPHTQTQARSAPTELVRTIAHSNSITSSAHTYTEKLTSSSIPSAQRSTFCSFCTSAWRLTRNITESVRKHTS